MAHDQFSQELAGVEPKGPLYRDVVGSQEVSDIAPSRSTEHVVHDEGVELICRGSERPALRTSLTGEKLKIDVIDKQTWKDTKDRETFVIHESLLDLNGTLLSLASQPSTQEPPYKLSEFSIQIFQLYVDWLYHRELQVVKLPDEDKKDKFEKLGEAFALGYCIQEMDFQIAVVNDILKFAQVLNGFPGYELNDIVYRLDACRALRELMVDLWVWKATRQWGSVADVECIAREELDITDFEGMFAVEVCKALVRVRPVPGQKVLATEEKPWENAEKYYMHILEQTWGSAGARYQNNLIEAMGEGGHLRFAQLGRNDFGLQ
ncbi:hypothetical protein E8E11_006148 [Didymella keratinophila]|nr:hypothetical protein E8E11_006148 [Didymella keratinophila]